MREQIVKVSWKGDGEVEFWNLDKAAEHLKDNYLLTGSQIKEDLLAGVVFESPFAFWEVAS